AARAEERADEVGRRALAVRARDADERRARGAVAELELADHLQAGRARGHRERVRHRQPGAPDDEVVAGEERGVVAAPDRGDALRGERPRGVGRVIGGPAVADRDLDAVAAEELRRGDAAAGGPGDERAAAGQGMSTIECHWNLNVDRDRSANSAP